MQARLICVLPFDCCVFSALTTRTVFLLGLEGGALLGRVVAALCVCDMMVGL